MIPAIYRHIRAGLKSGVKNPGDRSGWESQTIEKPSLVITWLFSLNTR